ncbi:MAG: hypothetical protein HC933_03285 [Pleurocapsa sp. SU_196_0]|nr:hypothetical protein [Pleurocapsa sp. SU_196_0]
MEDENSSRVPLVVRDERTAAFLNDEAKARLFLPFLAREVSLKEAALETGLKLNAMGYWARRLTDMGLIEIVRLERRHGSPIRRYRSVADEIVVPIALIPAVSDEELLLRRVDWHWRTFQRSSARQGRKLYPDWHLRFRRDAHGQTTWAVEPSIPPGQPAALGLHPLDLWGTLLLSAEDASELHHALEATIRQYATRSVTNAAPDGRLGYMVHVGLVEFTQTDDP